MSQGALSDIRTPAGWQWEPLGFMAPRVAEDGYGNLEPLSVYLGAGVVRRADREDNHNVLGADLDKYLRVLPGDLVFNKLRTWQGGLGASSYEGIVSPAYYVLRPVDRLDSRFVHYMLVSTPYLAELTRLSKFMPPSQFDMPWEALKRLPILLPPVEEQRRIADFLDDQVARIDEATGLCIDLIDSSVEAFKSAVIERTTFGLERVAQVSTGVPWKPLMSEGWNLRPMRSFLRYSKRLVGERWMDFTLLSLTKQGVIPRDLESNHGKFPESFDSYQVVEPGDLVMCLFDVDETPRTVGLAHERGMVTGAYTRFVWTDSGVNSRFVELSLIGIDDQKSFRPLYTGMRKGIQTGRFLSAGLPIPTPDVQERVVRSLDELQDELTSYRSKTKGRIELLEERKRAVITAAVTGELDVTTARSIGMGKWVPNVGASVESATAAQAQAPSIGGIE